MNYSFDRPVPKHLRQLTHANFFLNNKIYFNAVTAVLVELRSRTEKVTQVYSSNKNQKEITIQELYLKFEDGNEKCIEFIDSKIKAIKDHLLTLIFVRSPGESNKGCVAIYNHNLKGFFPNQNIYKKTEISKFLNHFSKPKISYDVISHPFIALLFAFLSRTILDLLFGSSSNDPFQHYLAIVLGILLFLLLCIAWINERVMENKFRKHLEKIGNNFKDIGVSLDEKETGLEAD